MLPSNTINSTITIKIGSPYLISFPDAGVINEIKSIVIEFINLLSSYSTCQKFRVSDANRYRSMDLVMATHIAVKPYFKKDGAYVQDKSSNPPLWCALS